MPLSMPGNEPSFRCDTDGLAACRDQVDLVNVEWRSPGDRTIDPCSLTARTSRSRRRSRRASLTWEAADRRAERVSAEREEHMCL